MKTPKTILAILATLLLALGVAACGGDDEEKPSGGGGGDGAASKQIKKVSGAASKGTITVGSKNFPEQFILGNIYAEALSAAGFKVKKSLDIGSEVPVNKVPKDAKAAYDQTKQRLAEQKITALAQTPFENTYRLAMTKEKHKEIGSPKTNTALKGKESDLTIAGFPECKQRIDCLVGIRKVYGLDFGKFISSQQQYDVLDNGSADVLFGFTTDGELTTGKYVLLEDDKQLWPPYHVSFIIRDDALQKIGPEGQKVIEQVQKPLTEKVMGELNSRVVLDKQEPEKVAADYLREAGFTR